MPRSLLQSLLGAGTISLIAALAGGCSAGKSLHGGAGGEPDGSGGAGATGGGGDATAGTKGAAATALPFYPLLEDSFALAAGETLPLRFVTISHPHGMALEYWGMRSPSSPDIAVERLSLRGTDTETNFDISYPNCSLQPFDDPATYGKSFKDRLLLIEGLDLAMDGYDAVASILTGSTLNNSLPANSSLDQYLAVEKGLGATTVKSNIVLGVGDPNPNAGDSLSFSAGGAGMSKIISPFDAFDFLFSGFVPKDDAASQAAAMRRGGQGVGVTHLRYPVRTG